MGHLRSGIFVVVVALTLLIIHGKSVNAERDDSVAIITKWEQDAAAADLTGNVSFYKNGLAQDWTDGMSNGRFQTKAELLADFVDKSKYVTLSESLSDIKVRTYGNTAIATYTEKYVALLDGHRRSRTIITTDTFVKIEDKWTHVAAHSSEVSNRNL
jgi:hypothetical protein